jgi:hypothetical protein
MNWTVSPKLATRALALLLLACLPGTAAAIITVDSVPAAVTVPPGRTTPTYTVRWRITKSLPATAPISSAQGVFLAPGPVTIGTNPVRLADPGPIGAVPTTTIVTERVRIPPAVIERARQLGASTIDYYRLWEDAAAVESGEAAVDIHFVGGLGGPFQVTRFELRFDDQSSLRIVRPNERFTAVANVNYSGAGVIDAVWEIAGSAQSRAIEQTTLFRSLRQVRRRLAGSGRVLLESPPLPSVGSGLHLVRLRFVEPDTAFELPAIRYFVSAGTSPQLGAAPGPVELRSPPHLASIDENASFAWQPVAGANVYRIELFAAPETRADATRPEESLESGSQRAIDRTLLSLTSGPAAGEFVTGAVVPADQVKVDLTAPMRRSLRPGRSYLWRVRGLSAEGAVIAESPIREVRTTPSARLGEAP